MKLKFTPVMMIIGLVIIFFLIKKAGFDTFLKILISLNVYYVILSLLARLIVLFFGAYRLKRLVGSDLTYFEVFRIYVYGMLLNYGAMIQGIGIAAKIGLFKQKKVQISKSFSGITAELAYDGLFAMGVSILFLFSIGIVFFNELKQLLNLKLLIAAAIAIAIIAIVLYFIGRRRHFFKEYLQNILQSFKINNLFKNIILTCFIWIFTIISIFFIFIAARELLHPWFILGSVALGLVIGFLSFIPGGLGVRDTVWAYGYSLGGIALSTAIPVAIIARFMNILLLIILIPLIKLLEKTSLPVP